jgi:hypothetical protein
MYSPQFGNEVEHFIIADFEGGKWIVSIGHEHGILPSTVRTIIADGQKYKDIAKLAMPGTNVWEQEIIFAQNGGIIDLDFWSAG